MSVTVLILFFSGMGILGLAVPHRIPGLFGMAADTPDARNEIRAVYGGFGLALSGLLIYALRAPAVREGVLLTVMVAMLGMAGGRMLGILRERTGRWPVVFLVIELALAGFAYLGMR